MEEITLLLMSRTLSSIQLQYLFPIYTRCTIMGVCPRCHNYGSSHPLDRSFPDGNVSRILYPHDLKLRVFTHLLCARPGCAPNSLIFSVTCDFHTRRSGGFKISSTVIPQGTRTSGTYRFEKSDKKCSDITELKTRKSSVWYHHSVQVIGIHICLGTKSQRSSSWLVKR